MLLFYFKKGFYFYFYRKIAAELFFRTDSNHKVNSILINISLKTDIFSNIEKNVRDLQIFKSAHKRFFFMHRICVCFYI